MPKYTCLHCENEFEGSPCYDELGWHISCPKCKGSFDIDPPDIYREVAIEVVERFEDLLESHGIMIPDDDRTGSEDEAPIYGCTFYNLIDDIANTIFKYHSELGE